MGRANVTAMSGGPTGASRCPDCGEPYDGRPERCPACGLLLVGFTAARLWAVDQHIAALLVERRALVKALRDGSATASAGASATPTSWPAGPQPGMPARYTRQRPRVEWSRRRVQNLLLSLGVLLLAVAALIFVAVNWGTLGAGGRAAVMAAVTLSAAGAATAAARRGLPATAESVAVLTVALLIVDAVGLRRTGVATGISVAGYAGAVAAVIAVLTGVWSSIVRLRSLRICALLAAQLVLPLSTGQSVVRPAGVAAVYGLQTAALLVIRFRAPLVAHVDVRILRISTYAWWSFALIACAGALYGRPAVRSPWGLAEFAALAALAVWAARYEYAEVHLALATATAIAAACAGTPRLDASWRAPVIEAVALLAALAVRLAIPARVARASAAVVAATGLGALMTAVKPIGQAVFAPLGVQGDEVWRSTWSQITHLASVDALRSGEHWSGTSRLTLLAFAALATATLLAPRSTGVARQAAGPVVAGLAVANLVLVPFEAAWTVPVAVAWDLALGALLLSAGTARKPQSHRVAMVMGAGFLVHGALWSLRSAALTVIAVGVVLAVTAVAAAAWNSRDRLVLATSAAVLLPVEAALFARYQGSSFAGTGVVLAATAAGLLAFTHLACTHGSVRRLDDVYTTALQVVALAAAVVGLGMAGAEPAASATALGFLIAGTGPAVVVGRGPLAPAWPAIVQALVFLEADAVHRWIAPDADLSARALVVAVAAAVVTVVVYSLLSQKANSVTLITGPACYALAVLATIAGIRLDPVWIALLVGGAAAAVVAVVKPPRTIPATVSAVLILASSWVRLGEAHVHAVEPYTVPAALLLLGLGHTRRREASSWSCYGPGLLLGLAPSLAQALTDPGLLRPALIGLAALAAVIAGAKARLQAPLAVGGGVLAVDAVAQLAPYLADAYNAVPRWSLIAAAGALLLILGVTYERRIRDLRALGKRFGGLR